MNKKEFEFLLEQGEWLKEIGSFADTEGGMIFIGVSDKEEIKGIEAANKLKSEIQCIARNCDPSNSVRLEQIDNALTIHAEEGMKKPYRCSAGFFTVTFNRPPMPTRLGERLGENQRKIVEIILKDRLVSIPEIAKATGISTTAVENNIAKLREKNILKRIGGARGGHWEIDENER